MSDNLKGKKILLVDDDPDILTSLQATFETTGADLRTAKSGNEAVEMAEKDMPDLMILDMMLPGRSGFLVLEKLKKRKPTDKPRVIMITGNTGSRHKMFADTYGVNEYFTKPVKMDKLLTTAEKLLT
jgi:DNA-binding response OmpR family regulator